MCYYYILLSYYKHIIFPIGFNKDKYMITIVNECMFFKLMTGLLFSACQDFMKQWQNKTPASTDQVEKVMNMNFGIRCGNMLGMLMHTQ